MICNLLLECNKVICPILLVYPFGINSCHRTLCLRSRWVEVLHSLLYIIDGCLIGFPRILRYECGLKFDNLVNHLLHIGNGHISPLLLELVEFLEHMVQHSGRGALEVIEDVKVCITTLKLLPLILFKSILGIFLRLLLCPFTSIVFHPLCSLVVAILLLECPINLGKFLHLLEFDFSHLPDRITGIVDVLLESLPLLFQGLILDLFKHFLEFLEEFILAIIPDFINLCKDVLPYVLKRGVGYAEHILSDVLRDIEFLEFKGKPILVKPLLYRVNQLLVIGFLYLDTPLKGELSFRKFSLNLVLLLCRILGEPIEERDYSILREHIKCIDGNCLSILLNTTHTLKEGISILRYSTLLGGHKVELIGKFLVCGVEFLCGPYPIGHNIFAATSPFLLIDTEKPLICRLKLLYIGFVVFILGLAYSACTRLIGTHEPLVLIEVLLDIIGNIRSRLIRLEDFRRKLLPCGLILGGKSFHILDELIVLLLPLEESIFAISLNNGRIYREIDLLCGNPRHQVLNRIIDLQRVERGSNLGINHHLLLLAHTRYLFDRIFL